MDKELNEAKRVLNMWNKAEEFVINDTDNFNKEPYIQRKKAIETVLNYIENSIPKKKIEDKIKELNKNIDLSIDNSKGGLDEDFIDKGTELLAKKRILQELLEDK